MLRRKVADRDDARSCIEAAAASGLARSAWALANGVDGRSLQAWWLILQRAGKPRTDAPLRLVEMVAVEPEPDATYVIRCGSMAVEVDARFDDDILRRLLGVVASC